MKATRSLVMDAMSTLFILATVFVNFAVFLGVVGVAIFLWNLRLNGGTLHYVQVDPVKVGAKPVESEAKDA